MKYGTARARMRKRQGSIMWAGIQVAAAVSVRAIYLLSARVVAGSGLDEQVTIRRCL